jgi:hypothetical protein
VSNQSGSIYGLTILSPIKDEPHLEISHSLAIRMYLQHLDILLKDGESPFFKVNSTHMARLVVLDDVVYFGMPSCEEHLQSKYLIFETNFDGDLGTYLSRLAREAKEEVHNIWQHCIGYPGLDDVPAFVAYMKRCQIETTFYFADVNDKTVQQTLRALQTQSAVASFIEKNQGKPPDELQRAFVEFSKRLHGAPTPKPGSTKGKEFTDKLL